MKQRKKLSDYKYPLLLTVFALALCWVLLRPYTLARHDTYFHLTRLESLVEAIRNGHLLPRMYPHIYNDFGYAVSLFYSDFLLYIPAALVLLGVSTLTSFKIFETLIVVATVLSAYYCASKLLQDKTAAAITAMLYTGSSYFAVDLFTRGALGESQAFIFLPFCLLGMYNAIFGDAKDRTPLIIGFTGLVLSHNLSLMLTALLFAFFLLLNIVRLFREPSRIWELVKSVLTVLMLSAFFFFPMAEQLLTEKFFSTYHCKIWNPGKAAIRIRHLFLGANLSEDPVFTPSLGLTMLIAFVVCLVLVFRKPKDDLHRFFSCMFLVACICLFASTSVFPWYPLDPYLNIIQFPSRMFIFVTLFLSFGVGFWWSRHVHLASRKAALAIALAAVICFVQFSCVTAASLKIILEQKRTITNTSNMPFWDENYLNGNNNRQLWRDRELYVNTVRGVHGPVDYSMERDYDHRYITFSGNSTDNALEVAAVYFRGYRAVDTATGEKLPISPSKNGWLQVEIGSRPSGEIVIDYYGTTIQHISPYITLLFVLGMLGWHLYRRKHPAPANA